MHENKPQAVGGSEEQPEIVEETEVNKENNGTEVQPGGEQPETVEETAETNNK